MLAAPPPHHASIGDKVAFLCSPESYRYTERQPQVEVIETHMSWVFLTRTLAYKLKKPARHEFLDFSTLAARRRNCEREVALNRRLAPGVYRGSVPLTLARDGHLNLHGAGRVVDWLVVMRRLPAERLLNNLIAARGVDARDLQRLARMLAGFYRGAVPARITAARQRQRFLAQLQANRAELLNTAYGLPRGLVRDVTAAQQRFLDTRGDLLAARAHRIVDAHGDLRPEHVCLTPRPVIIDCLEFKREFRLLDPADELAYFAMECARLGNAAAGEAVLRQVLKSLDDAPPEALLDFYKTFRATLRATIAIWHLADRHINHAAHWRRRACAYLNVARRYATKI